MTTRTILIDPETRTIEELAIELSDEEIERIIGCDSFAVSATLNGSIETGFDAIYVSEDDPEDTSPRFWFEVDAADRDSPHPIAGRGLVVGTDRDGGDCDARISLDELRARITFTQRKFRGFETLTGAAARERGADLIVEIKAPIIDGTDEGQ